MDGKLTLIYLWIQLIRPLFKEIHICNKRCTHLCYSIMLVFLHGSLGSLELLMLINIFIKECIVPFQVCWIIILFFGTLFRTVSVNCGYCVLFWQKKTARFKYCLTLVLAMYCLCKQCRSRSVGFWRSQLIWVYTVCHSVCEFVSTTWIKQSNWMTIRSGHDILIY